ncbi:22936_t:CDS:1, partial [Dentiscutata erythropus]
VPWGQDYLFSTKDDQYDWRIVDNEHYKVRLQTHIAKLTNVTKTTINLPRNNISRKINIRCRNQKPHQTE